jgi:hypothetical protein
MGIIGTQEQQTNDAMVALFFTGNFVKAENGMRILEHAHNTLKWMDTRLFININQNSKCLPDIG